MCNFNTFNFQFPFTRTTTTAPSKPMCTLRLTHHNAKITADNIEEAAEKLNEINAKMTDLIQILEDFGEWYDETSNDLHDWGCDILSIELPKHVGEPSEIPVEEQLQTLNAALNKIHTFSAQQVSLLFTKILTNPLSPQQTLHEPHYDRHWLWEKKWLDTYLALPEMEGKPKYSPFEPFEQRIEIDARPHLFAAKILQWAQKHFKVEANENNAISTSTSNSCAPPSCLKDFVCLANNAVGIRHQRCMQKMTKMFTEQVNIFAQEKEEEVAAAKEKAQQEHAAHQQATEERLNKMEAQQQKNTAEQEALNKENARKLAEEQQKQAEIKRLLAEKETQMQRLRQQIAEMQRQINEIRSSNNRSSCTLL